MARVMVRVSDRVMVWLRSGFRFRTRLKRIYIN